MLASLVPVIIGVGNSILECLPEFTIVLRFCTAVIGFVIAVHGAVRLRWRR